MTHTARILILFALILCWEPWILENYDGEWQGPITPNEEA